MPERFEEEYEDVLQNIEVALVRVYRSHPDMTDFEALDAIQAAIRSFQAEAQERALPAPKLRPLAQEAYDGVVMMCEWRLGRRSLQVESDQPVEMPAPKTLDEIVLCLKRIRRSIEMWNKQGGRRGYFNFVGEFVQ